MNNTRSKLVTEKLREYASKEKKPLLIGLLLSMIRTAMEIIGPLIIGFILNNYIKTQMSLSAFKSIIMLLSIYLLVYLLSGWFSNWAIISFEKAANRIAFNAQKDVYFTVRSGMSPRQVAQGLKDKGLVRNSRTFYQYIKTNELGEKFTAGTYKLRQSMTAQEIAKTLIDGEVATDLFTIIPGTNIGQIKKSMIATGQF